MDRIEGKLDADIPAEFHQELSQWVRLPSQFFLPGSIDASGRHTWSDMKTPVGLGVYHEACGFRSYVEHLPQATRKEILERRPYGILLHFMLKHSRDVALIRRLVHMYEEDFPEVIRGSEEVNLRPIWCHVIEAGHADVFQELIEMCAIPTVSELGAQYMATATELAPSFEILEWLHNKGVPVPFSGLATIESRQIITKGSEEWAFLTHGSSDD
ncbi:hypothetical protein F5Y04DRAFT_278899 [Hypomontagnella monticulosa]|nr:hypothetical protein F5Y04DRAFT_278899 [Hypomontagnella monticulosa]